MNQNDLITSLNKIKPELGADERMLRRVLAYQPPKHTTVRFVTPYAAAAALLCLVAIGLFAFPWSNSLPMTPVTSDGGAISSNSEIAVALESFVFDGKRYSKLTNETLSEMGIQQPSGEKELGALLGTLDAGEGSTLSGSKIYAYPPLSAPAVVVVEKNGGYELFLFSSFTAYEENSDEDAADYLSVYGIKSADDLSKVEVYTYPTATSEVLSHTLKKEEQDIFYDGFSKLKNASGAYFKTLGITSSESREGAWQEFSDSSTVRYEFVPSNDALSAASSKNGDKPSNAASYEGSAGGKLEGGIRLNIIAKNGLSFDMWFYPRIGFLSRFQPQGEFLEFLNNLAN